ncbi:pyridoxal phosphate-dependent transferase [Polychytrium aggregatum]|uniref:pyridoxal phosphate-dependent transferase n=1 Tax=Polychytrium aggregatum TaxID=110093 RepID=UPI0022FEF0E0|nr:pyridoxal phosphate-dependent transferase [Polychytrium aggregatum]KAI9197400.1 pyridoxal phosphate-dependent transferase [Polychytrium aggregatum]
MSQSLPIQLPLGSPIPPISSHAISVSLPSWLDNIGYEEADPEVITKLKSGYPRFVYHAKVKLLCAFFEKKLALPSESCLVFRSRRIAQECRDFICIQVARLAPPPSGTEPQPKTPTKPPARIAEYTLSSSLQSFSALDASKPAPAAAPAPAPIYLHVVLFAKSWAPVAKQFWQHSGEGISSRFAEHALRIIESNERALSLEAGRSNGRAPQNPYYKASQFKNSSAVALQQLQSSIDRDQELFLDERFGRNLNLAFGAPAKAVLRKRIAGILGDSMDGSDELLEQLSQPAEPETAAGAAASRSSRLPESNVFLFSTGMSAIYNSHRLVLRLFPGLKSVQFGFPYLDTLKIQQKFGPGCHFLGHGSPNDLDHLVNDILPNEPISAVFCEFPSNPLLRSADLARLRSLADQYGFLLIIDDTIGNFVNVAAIDYADVVVSSLSKIFSGDSDVTGGSLVVNPSGRHVERILATLHEIYEDTVWIEDAIYLERNSRKNRERIQIIDSNAERLCEFLHGHPKVVQLFYPKYTDREIYDRFKRPQGGYGGLFSVVLQDEQQASRFYDHLHVAKGPSLGTIFTLASPYAILAHYGELDWAKSFGVDRHLIRVSVGTENYDDLERTFREALDSC